MHLPGAACTMSDPLLSRHAHVSQAVLSRGRRAPSAVACNNSCSAVWAVSCPSLCPPSCHELARAVPSKGAEHRQPSTATAAAALHLCEPLATCPAGQLTHALRCAMNSQALSSVGALLQLVLIAPRHVHNSQALFALGAQDVDGLQQQKLQQVLHLCKPLATCPYLCPPPCT